MTHYLAILVLAIHLLWILWVIFGALWTRGHALLTAFHILSLTWGIIVEVSPLDCPLTIVEQLFEQQAGTDSYRGAFVANYLDRLVYPDIPEPVLVTVAVIVCLLNFSVYIWRYRQWQTTN